MDVPSYDEMWAELLVAGVQISEIQRCIEWRIREKASITIQHAMRERLAMKRHKHCEAVGLTISFIGGLERRAVDEGGRCGYFLKNLLYRSQEYIDAWPNTNAPRMGQSACNWKDSSGEYRAPVFQTMARTYWRLQKKAGGCERAQTEQESTTTEQPVEGETPSTSEDLHGGNSRQVSHYITNEELENFWSKIPTTNVSVDDEDFDGEKWGLTPAFQIAGFD